MVYSDVINNNYHLILNKKKKYNKKDVFKVYDRLQGKVNLNEARFITVCTAIFYDAEYTKMLGNSLQFQLKTMFC